MRHLKIIINARVYILAFIIFGAFLTLFQNFQQASFSEFSAQVEEEEHNEQLFDVTVSPPKLVNPIIIDVAKLAPVNSGQEAIHLCFGKLYDIRIPSGQDAIVTTSERLRYPVIIGGGRHVHMIGLDIELVDQPGCQAEYEIKKTPIGSGLRIAQSHTSYIEGLKMDLKGHLADCIASSNTADVTDAQALKVRDVVVQNSACRGGRGQFKGHPYGDGLHADFFQNQGRSGSDGRTELINEPMNSIIFENISHVTTASGIVIDGQVNSERIRNLEFSLDTRYPKYNNVLNPAWLVGNKWEIENVYTDFKPPNLMASSIQSSTSGSGKYYTFFEAGLSYIFHPEMHRGKPEKTFAPWELLGTSYQSPHLRPWLIRNLRAEYKKKVSALMPVIQELLLE